MQHNEQFKEWSKDVSVDILGRSVKEDAAVLSRRERKKRDQKYTIIRVAQNLIEEKGYDGTSISEIAEAADISYATFFNYFPTKDMMLLSIAQGEYEDLKEVMNLRFTKEDAAATILRGVFLEWCGDSYRYRNVDLRLEEVCMRMEADKSSPSVLTLLMDILNKGIQNGEFQAEVNVEMIALLLSGIRLGIARTGRLDMAEACFDHILKSISA